MINRRVLPLGLVASASLAVLVATAQDRGARDAGAKDTGSGTKDSGAGWAPGPGRRPG